VGVVAYRNKFSLIKIGCSTLICPSLPDSLYTGGVALAVDAMHRFEKDSGIEILYNIIFPKKSEKEEHSKCLDFYASELQVAALSGILNLTGSSSHRVGGAGGGSVIEIVKKILELLELHRLCDVHASGMQCVVGNGGAEWKMSYSNGARSCKRGRNGSDSMRCLV
jgi:hypothetical protein